MEETTPTPARSDIPQKFIAVDHDDHDVILYIQGGVDGLPTIEGHLDPSQAIDIAEQLLKQAGTVDREGVVARLSQTTVGQMIILGTAAYRAGISLTAMNGMAMLTRGESPVGVTPPVAGPTPMDDELQAAIDADAAETAPDPFAGLDEIVKRLD